MSNNKHKIAVGMSGGIDSTFAAITLREQGYDVVGIVLQMYCKQNPAKENEKNIVHQNEKVKEVCESLSIPLYTVDAQQEFKNSVIDDFSYSYLNGLTPNPCVVCNKQIKWKLLQKKANELGIKQIATGHYAEVEFSENLNRYLLKRGQDEKKDQSYFLWQLEQKDLANTKFPLAQYSKDEIRKKITAYNLKLAQQPESQEICFIPKDDYKAYLQSHFSNKIKSGNILNLEGEKIGEHKGLPFYTIGQRRGLGLTYPHPLYVKELRIETNEIVVGPQDSLFGIELFANNCNWIQFEDLIEPLQSTAKIRYNSPDENCTIFPQKEGVRVLFDEPVSSITPGQSVVFYNKEYLIGGGIIKSEINE